MDKEKIKQIWIKAKKKPIIINCFQITNKNILNLHNIDNRLGNISRVPFCDTIEGTMNGKINDYVIKGIRGELYICDKEIFEDSYEVQR